MQILNYIERLFSQVDFTPTCWLWTGYSKNGRYGHMGWGGAGRAKPVHVIVYELCVGPVPPGKKVLHKCDVTKCMRPNHLKLGTQRDNLQDCIVRNRIGRCDGKFCEATRC